MANVRRNLTLKLNVRPVTSFLRIQNVSINIKNGFAIITNYAINALDITRLKESMYVANFFVKHALFITIQIEV
jgi:hypothetical protein